MSENFCKKFKLCFACREKHHPWCCKSLKSNAPQHPGVPSAGFTVTRAEPNKTLPNPKRDLRRFLGALATFHISHTVTLWGWCRLNACAWLALYRAGFMQDWLYRGLALCRTGFMQGWLYAGLALYKTGFMQGWLYAGLVLCRAGCCLPCIPSWSHPPACAASLMFTSAACVAL